MAVDAARLLCALLLSSAAAWSPSCQPAAARAHARGAALRMQTPPFPLPYDVPDLPKPYSDYEWDDSYPGTLKPGLRGEGTTTEEVIEMWKDKKNGNVMELPRDQLWQVPLKPPEDILSWLDRIGLLDNSDDDDTPRGTEANLIDDEFDLDALDETEGLGNEGLAGLGPADEPGGTMSDFM